jgi:hypothetical protein
MLSLLGCASEDMQEVLGALGYRGRPEMQPDGTTVLLFRQRHRGSRQPERPREAEKPKRDFKRRPHHRQGKPQDRAPAPQQKQEQDVVKPAAAASPPHHKPKHEHRHKPKHEPRREPRPPREVRIDPNSPFAKLAILKNKT